MLAPISNTAGVLLRYYGKLTQQICFTYHWINKTLWFFFLSMLQFNSCFILQNKSVTVSHVTIGLNNRSILCLPLRLFVISFSLWFSPLQKSAKLRLPQQIKQKLYRDRNRGKICQSADSSYETNVKKIKSPLIPAETFIFQTLWSRKNIYPEKSSPVETFPDTQSYRKLLQVIHLKTCTVSSTNAFKCCFTLWWFLQMITCYTSPTVGSKVQFPSCWRTLMIAEADHQFFVNSADDRHSFSTCLFLLSSQCSVTPSRSFLIWTLIRHGFQQLTACWEWMILWKTCGKLVSDCSIFLSKTWISKHRMLLLTFQ